MSSRGGFRGGRGGFRGGRGGFRGGKTARQLENQRAKKEALLQVEQLVQRQAKDDVGRQLSTLEQERAAAERQGRATLPAEGPRLKKPRLSGDEYEALRKRLHERKMQLRKLPRLRVNSLGVQSGLKMEISARTPLFPADLQQLLLFTMIGDRTPNTPLRWCVLDKWNRLTNVVCLCVEGVGLDQWTSSPDNADADDAGLLSPSQLEHRSALKTLLPNQFEMLSPASFESSLARELAVLPVSKAYRKRLIMEYGDLDVVTAAGHLFNASRTVAPTQVRARLELHAEARTLVSQAHADLPLKLRLMLSMRQLVEEGYPVPLPGHMTLKYKHYLPTSDEYKPVSADSPMFGIDCEMCLTTARKNELTRVCVIDENNEVVYHSLVLPYNRITNYLTEFSGITPQLLRGVETRLRDVQIAIRKLLPPDAVLVGQSLQGDLHALQLYHPYVIDSSVIFNLTGERRRKSKLSKLSSLFLKEEIQTAGAAGHNPEEDAIASMKLVQKKLEEGYEYGDVLLNGEVPAEAQPAPAPTPADKKTPAKQLDDVQKSSSAVELSVSMLGLMQRSGERKVRVVCTSELAGQYGGGQDKEDKDKSDKSEDNEKEDKAKLRKDSASRTWRQHNKAKKDIKKLKQPAPVTEADDNAAALAAAVASCDENDFTLCHVSLDDKKKDLLATLRSMAESLWAKVKVNGMLLVVLSGTREQPGVVGVATRKHELVLQMERERGIQEEKEEDVEIVPYKDR